MRGRLARWLRSLLPALRGRVLDSNGRTAGLAELRRRTWGSKRTGCGSITCRGLRVEYGIEKPSNKLFALADLDSNTWVREVKRIRGKKRPRPGPTFYTNPPPASTRYATNLLNAESARRRFALARQGMRGGKAKG